MHKKSTFHAVCDAFARYFEVHPARVAEYHDLQNDWGLAPFELELIARHVEETLGFDLESYDALSGLQTVGQLVRLFRAQGRRSRWQATVEARKQTIQTTAN
jgi:hypothetical protein